jgi:riboflavin synthase
MFTGLIQDVGPIIERVKNKAPQPFTIQTRFESLRLGESIAVNGACLTVIAMSEGQFTCEISPETLSRTMLDDLSVGSRVNLERALCVGDRLGGHFVSGHVDQVLSLQARESVGECVEMMFGDLLPHYRRYLVEKGSVAINGVSLTINAITENNLSVMLVPHTLAHTNLIDVAVGERVNLEYDSLAKMVAAQLEPYIRHPS